MTDPKENPPVPASGINADLLDWCMVCAGNNRMLNDQLKAIRELENER